MISLGDAFAVGIGFDLAGAYLLGRGLFSSAETILHRSTPRYDFHPGQAVGRAEDRVDGEAGIACLLVGFSLQVVAYALGDLSVGNRGAVESFGVAAGLALATAAFAAFAWLRFVRRWRLWRVLIEMARFDRAFRRHELPSANRLQDFGMALGIGATERECLPPDGPALYARRVFGVAAVRPALDVELDVASLSKFAGSG